MRHILKQRIVGLGLRGTCSCGHWIGTVSLANGFPIADKGLADMHHDHARQSTVVGYFGEEQDPLRPDLDGTSSRETSPPRLPFGYLFNARDGGWEVLDIDGRCYVALTDTIEQAVRDFWANYEG